MNKDWQTAKHLVFIWMMYCFAVITALCYFVFKLASCVLK